MKDQHNMRFNCLHHEYFSNSALLKENYDAVRQFNFNYIYADFLFLVIYIAVLCYYAFFYQILIAVFLSIIIFLIDTQIWYKTQSSIPDHNIREYYIYIDMGNGEIREANTPYNKFLADIMMTVSYGIVAFAWDFIVFQDINDRVYDNALLILLMIFAGWSFVGMTQMFGGSEALQVCTVRHMSRQYWISIIITAIGYGILFVIDVTVHIICILFIVGMIQLILMEAPLIMFRIRPFEPTRFLYELFFLINQGIPYLYILYLWFL